MHGLALAQSIGVAIEMCVVVAEGPGWVELIDRETAGLAGEQLGHRTVLSRDHRCPPRRHDVDRFVGLAGAARFRERIPQLRPFHAFYRHLKRPTPQRGDGRRVRDGASGADRWRVAALSGTLDG